MTEDETVVAQRLKQRVAEAGGRPISRRPQPLALLPVRAAIPRVGIEHRPARRPESEGRRLAANRAVPARRRAYVRDWLVHRSGSRFHKIRLFLGE